MKPLRQLFDNLKIKNKLLLFQVVTVLFIGIFTLLGVNRALAFYDDLLYQSAAESLMLSTMSIENELKKAESYTYSMVSDRSIQELMLSIKYEESPFVRRTKINELMKRLLGYVVAESSITSISFIDQAGNQYVDGHNPINFLEDVKHYMIHAATDKSGEVVIIDQFPEQHFISVARQIRSVKELSLENLGIVALRMRTTDIGQVYRRHQAQPGTHFMIFSDTRLLYDSQPLSDMAEVLPEVILKTENSGYTILRHNQDRFFLTYTPSAYSGWLYVVMMPYNQVFEEALILRQNLVVLLLILFLISLIFAVVAARSITKPLERLTMRIKRVEKGDFSPVPLNIMEKHRTDEIGMLHDDFEMMRIKIQALIEDNYKNQIVLKDTQMKALQAQMNPHFLYNTLESIYCMAKLHGQQDIAGMVDALGVLLRNAVNTKEKEVALKDEVAALKAYITIQKVRYDDRLIFNDQIPEGLLTCLVPHLCLQPLVENAIIHGLEHMLEPCTIGLSAHIQEDCLFLKVSDNGKGFHVGAVKASKRGMGIGIDNIQERLHMLYGDAGCLYVQSVIGEGTTVTIQLPIRKR